MNASLEQIIAMGKKKYLKAYQSLTPPEQDQFKELPQKLHEAQTVNEMLGAAKPLHQYLQNKQPMHL